MFVGITNTPRPYAWGSPTAIAELLGRASSGGPEAELWLGAHPGSPSLIIDPPQVAGSPDLAAWIAADPASALGRLASAGRLPFLLKILAAGRPLSLQAHPSAEQARLGFERENAAGIPIDAPQRNYRDPFPKPELVYALSPTFEALCGFRPAAETRAIVRTLLRMDARSATPQPQILQDLLERVDDLPKVFEWLISNGPGVAGLVDRVCAVAALGGGLGAGLDTGLCAGLDAGLGTALDARVDAGLDTRGEIDSELATVRLLAAEYPGDPGIVISLLLNQVTLRQGEALYLPAGNIHAYLEGVGVELMTASDNVLRGGLTPKHVDVPELLRVLDFRPGPVPYSRPSVPSAGVSVYRPSAADFVLVHIHGDPVDATYDLIGPGIAICTKGAVSIAGAVSSVTLRRGHAVYITPDEGTLAFCGSGQVFVATTQ